MFDKTATYHKSPRGAEAIATRSAALGPKGRSMLILIDGKRSFAELLKLGQMLGDPEKLMQDLAEQGLIEPVAGAAPPRVAAPAVSAAAAGPPSGYPAVPLLQAQRFAVRRLTDLLGPAAEDICLRIESTRNAQDFQAAVQKAENMLRQLRGAQMASQFAADMQTHRPG